MHLTLHLTERCNLRCTYCYEKHGTRKLSFEKAIQAIRECAWEPNSGIIFFGGEPLLCRDLIFRIIEWCESEWPHNFHYKVTTNGMLLDDTFLQQAQQHSLQIAMSFDGLPAAHDTFRVDACGTGSAGTLEPKLGLLLTHRPYAPIMMTVNPETVASFAEGVAWLYAKGARYLICSLNHAVNWDKRALAQLKKQYQRLAQWFLDRYQSGEKVYFSPFDKAIASLLVPNYCNSCRFGLRQVSVSATGRYYPCVQFVGDAAFVLGETGKGLDHAIQARLFAENEAAKSECGNCAIQSRCHARCACLNRQATGDYKTVAPLLCEHERIVVPIADRIATRLYNKKNDLFIQRYYNPLFPILSYLDDLAG
jgi:uncharacterized protein